MTPPVTVAVVSWNTRELLRECIRSLTPDAAAGRADVWVVDNGSADGSREMVRSEFPGVSLIEPAENLGFGAAVNEVARRTDGPWIAPSNADVALRAGALEALLAVGRADPEAGIVAPRLLKPDASTQHSVHTFPTLALALALNLGLARRSPRLAHRLLLEGHWDPERPRSVDWAHGAFLLVRREAFDAAGGFDAGQWMYAEDVDLAWRLSRAGWRTRYEPTAAVRHEVAAATSKAFREDRRRRYMGALYAWMARRRGLAFTRAYALLNVGGAAVRLVVLAPLRVLTPGLRAAYARERARLPVHLIGLRSRDEILAAGRR